MAKRILVVDDEKELTELLQFNLEKEGYAVEAANDGEAGLEKAKKKSPDLIILDLMMPKVDGLEFCRRARQETALSQVPIIMLTARAEETDKIVGLELGADDYVTKPFSVREMMARVKAMLRRNQNPGVENLTLVRAGEISMDLSKHRVHAGKAEIILTSSEFNILRELAKRQGRVMTRDSLISSALGEDIMVTDRTIDVHIASLRKKLGKHGKYIETVRGVGYRFKES